MYYVQFDGITTDLDWDPVALQNALMMGLCEEKMDSSTYSDMPDELPACVTVC